MRGFFTDGELEVVKAPSSLIPNCTKCGLYRNCQSPKMEPSGKGTRRVLIVGESPSIDDDRSGKHFMDAGGKYLRETLQSIGVLPSSDCYFTNALICAPGKSTTQNLQVDYCRPNLIKTIETLDPEVVILMGYHAVKSLIPHTWNADVGKSLDRWLGWQIPSHKINAWICPTYPPSFLVKFRDKPLFNVMHNQFKSHLKTAFELKGKPWKVVPEYKKRIRTTLDDTEVANFLESCIDRGGYVAWDYETNMIKPDNDNAEIWTCAVCWQGKETLAFPWRGKAVPAMKKLLLSDLKKIGHNIKFEQRWTMAKLNCRVKYWDHDGMIAAHTLDNRHHICSCKFQSFVLLGQENYDNHIKPYLKSKKQGGNNENRIKELNLNDLLIYNGMDAFLEFKIAQVQKPLIDEGGVDVYR